MGVTALIKSNLSDLLYARRLTIREFARMIDYRFETVRQLYNNEISRVPLELVERVCLELRCTPGDLFTVTNDAGEVIGNTPLTQKGPTS